MSNEADSAILALLEGAALNVHDGYVTDSDEERKTVSAPLPYVVLYSSLGRPVNPRTGGPSGSRAQEFQVTHVGATREQSVWAGERVEGALQGQTVMVGGRRRLITRTDDFALVRRDDDWTRPDGGPLFFGALRFVLAY